MSCGSTRPKVGVGVLIVKDGMILLGRRSDPNTHGNATWAPPGGHLEFFETFEQCARREVLEETGLELGHVRFATVTNDFFIKEQKHYITIFMLAEYIKGIPQLLEPDKCSQWDWFSLDSLPESLFVSLANLLEQGYLSQVLEKKEESSIMSL